MGIKPQTETNIKSIYSKGNKGTTIYTCESMLNIAPLLFFSNVLARAIMISDRLNTTIYQNYNNIERIYN